MARQQHRLHGHAELAAQFDKAIGKSREPLDRDADCDLLSACRLQPRKVSARGIFEHPREELSSVGVSQDPLLLRDEVAISPVRLLRRQRCRQQKLVAVVELSAEDSAAPTVEHGVVEAEDVLEALIGAAEDVDAEERPTLPVEDVPLALAPSTPARYCSCSSRMPRKSSTASGSLIFLWTTCNGRSRSSRKPVRSIGCSSIQAPSACSKLA